MTLSNKTLKPRLACEITPESVIAARASAEAPGIALYTARKLAPNVIAPSLSANNVVDAVALRDALSGALASVAARGRDVIAILPDAAVHVLLLDFESLPEKPAEATPLIRFRIRKSLPFDVDKAALSYQSRRVNGTIKVMAAVTATEVLAGYETAFREAGYDPGVVLPSTLAALSTIEAYTPTLLVKIEGPYITMAIMNQDDVLLYRTLDAPNSRPLSGAEIAEAVYPSIVFFEDTYGARIQRIFLAGPTQLMETRAALEAQTGVRAEELTTDLAVGESLSGEATPNSALAGIAGVLAH
ncbi:MAG TPA: hypothetical protein VFZ99_03945 [Terriglobales bacterium]